MPSLGGHVFAPFNSKLLLSRNFQWILGLQVVRDYCNNVVHLVAIRKRSLKAVILHVFVGSPHFSGVPFELWKNHEQAAIEQEWKCPTKRIALNICGSSPHLTVLPQDPSVLHFFAYAQ